MVMNWKGHYVMFKGNSVNFGKGGDGETELICTKR